MDVPPIVDASWVESNGEVDLYFVSAGGGTGTGQPDGVRVVDLDTDLADPAGPVVGRHPLPEPERFAATLSRFGFEPDRVAVVYDDGVGAFAARFVWMLRALGYRAALWPGADGRAAERDGRGVRSETPTSVEPRPWPSHLLADADDVEAGDAAVIDSRAGARYRGEVEPIDAIAGHVPGAVNVPFEDHFVDGGLRQPAEIRARFAAAGIDSMDNDHPAIVYCGSGVTACLNLLAAESAGMGRGRLYVGSWSGWSTDPARSVAVGVD